MQTAQALLCLMFAMLLDNGWFLLAAAMTVVYGEGLARWDEERDLARRFGEPWRVYRAAVRNWIPRTRPYAGSESRLYVARGCDPDRPPHLRKITETR